MSAMSRLILQFSGLARPFEVTRTDQRCGRRITDRAPALARTTNLAFTRLGLICLLSVVGCEITTSPGDEHHHAHSHDQPRQTFTEAVAAVRKRSTRFTLRPVVIDDSLTAAKRTTLVEIIGKLPELAADTELRKTDWDRIDAISRELLMLLQPIPSQPMPNDVSGNSRLELLLAELEKLAVSSETK